MMCCFMFRTQIWGTADISSSGKQSNKTKAEQMAKQPDLDEFVVLSLTGPTDMVWVHNSEETSETTEGVVI